jgi:hypothetical protein
MNDPTAQMGFQVGQTALKHGTEYVEQNVGGIIWKVGFKMLTCRTVQPICQFLCAKTLFQRLQWLRRQ